MWSRLWQLTFFLRCGEEGMDSTYLKQAEVVRRRSYQLNWQQTLVHFSRFLTLLHDLAFNEAYIGLLWLSMAY